MVNANNSLNIGIWFGAIEGAHTEDQREGAGHFITQAMKVPAGVKVNVAPGKPGSADLVIEIEGYRSDLPAVLAGVLLRFDSWLADWQSLYGKTEKQHREAVERAEQIADGYRVRS